MVSDEQVARGILEGLQRAFVSKDPVQVASWLDDDMVLFGSAVESLDRAQSDDYVARILSLDATIRWGWDRVFPLWHHPDVIAFAVVGTVGFDDVHGEQEGERDPFRLTCVAVAREGGWRLRHFHGSVPQPT